MDKEEQWLLTEKYDGEKSRAFFADCERLKAGEPLAYLIGQVPFLGCTIHLDSRPLIPRAETEFGVERAIADIKRCQTFTNYPPQRPYPERGWDEAGTSGTLMHILDLCAGSGAIGVAILRHLENSQVTFGEIDEHHMATIQKNLIANNIDQKRATTVQSDLFENIHQTFDYIFCNPPYIDPALDRTEASVKTYEPQTALYGGKDGLEIIIRILDGARAKLAPHSTLWLEHEPEQTTALKQLAQEKGFSIVTHLDQFGLERYSVLMVL